MMIEMLIIAVIVFFVFIYNKWIDKDSIFGKNSKLIRMIKESDYDFLLIAKYGDRVYDPDEVFMKRIKDGVLVSVALIFVFLTNINYIGIILALVVGFIVYKSQYLSLRSWYKSHLSYIDSLLPYYLKTIEVLIHHYTVPVALAKSIDDAPEVFKPGLRKLVSRIEAGDSTIDPYMDFAKEYPVRDSMRMMRLLYRLGLGSNEDKHEQIMMFSKTVSSLQNKAREQKYKNRLESMEKRTMIMLFATGGGVMLILFLSMTIMMGI